MKFLTKQISNRKDRKMGVTVRQKRKGKVRPWYVFVHKDHQIWSKAIGDKKAAQAIASALRKKLAAGSLNISGQDSEKKVPEFCEYAQHYLEAYAKTACKRNTWKGYETIIRLHLAPE